MYCLSSIKTENLRLCIIPAHSLPILWRRGKPADSVDSLVGRLTRKQRGSGEKRSPFKMCVVMSKNMTS